MKNNYKNENIKEEIYDEKNGLWYQKEGDFYIPMITLKETKKVHLSKYGRARLKYLKEHKKGLYTELLMTEKLIDHLDEIDKLAKEKVEKLTKELAKKNGIKPYFDGSMDNLEWAGLMYNFRNSAEEIVYNEFIYN